MKKAILSLLILSAAAAWMIGSFSGVPTPDLIGSSDVITTADSLDALQPKVETRFFAAPVDTFGTFSLFGGYWFPTTGPWDMASDDSITIGADSTIGGFYVMLISGLPTHADTVFAVGNALNSDDSLGVAAAEDTSWFYMTDADTSGTAYQSDKRFAGLVTMHHTNAALGARSANYAMVDVWNDRGTDFTLTDVEIDGWGGATDAGFNIWVRKHQLNGWMYDATGIYNTGNYPTPVVKIGDTQGTDINLAAFTRFVWNQRDIGEAFDVSAHEGIVIDVKTTVANSLPSLNATLVYTE